MTQIDVKIDLQIWARLLRASFSKIEIFIKAHVDERDQSRVSDSDYHWKFLWQAGQSDIHPDDPRFSLGRYSVLLVNHDEDEDEFTHQPLGICL